MMLRQKLTGAVIVIAASLIVAILSSPLFRLWGVDEEIFQLVGKSVAEGGRLYQDVFDHKGPFFLWLYVLGWQLAGVLGYWIIFSCLWTCASVMFYFGILRCRIPVLSAIGFALSATIFPLVQGYPETLVSALVLLVLGCLFLTSSSKYLIYAEIFAGLCGAAVFFSKQTCCGFFLGLGLFFLLAHRFRDLIYYITGGILGLLLGGALMCMNGMFDEYLEFNWVFNARYAIPFGFWMFRRVFHILNLYGGEMIFGAAVLMALAWRWRDCGRNFWSYAIAIGAWLACDFFAIIRGWGVGEHQVQSLVFSCVCILPFMWRKISRADIFWTCTFYMAIIVSPLVMKIHTSCHAHEIDAPRRALITKLKSLPHAPLLVWENQCRFQLETGRSCLFAPYVQVVPLVVRNGIPETTADGLKGKLRTTPFVLVEGRKPGSDWMRGVPRYPNDNVTDTFYKEIAAVRDSRMVELPSPDPDYRLYISKELLAAK